MRYNILICCLCLSLNSFTQEGNVISLGLRMQKTHNLYFENGLTLDYCTPKILNNKLHLSFSYITSRLGTAFNSNAVKQDNYLLSTGYNFMNSKLINPIIQLNIGFFYSDMEYEIFQSLPHKSPLLSFETGIYVNPKYPYKAKATVGYNFITGDGVSGPGTLYPLFFELSIFYSFNF